ncbi:MAG: hypothetical protein JWP89_2756 [Schlesneria sp.]|nr:hypothetical protein [Schlesneria sp.]
MNTFFQGWRRKIGGIALLMACATMGGWSRSCQCDDVLSCRIGRDQHMFESSRESVHWWACDSGPHLRTLAWASLHDEFRFDRIGFARKSGTSGWTGFKNVVAGYRTRRWTVPYRAIVIPLTLLSVYLLLWSRSTVGGSRDA